MKRHTGKIFIFFFAAALAALSSLLLSGCLDDCVHQFSEWSSLFDATCQAEGTEIRNCTVCGYSESRSSQKTDHAYGSVVIVDRPTCIDAGSGKKICATCGATQTVPLAINPTAHEWGTPSVRPASCTEDGESVRICKLCERKDVAILLGGHEFEDDYPCHDRTCTVCQALVAGDGNHNFINDACACGTPHPDFTIAKAAERIRNATAKTLAYDGNFSVRTPNGAATFYPLTGELSERSEGGSQISYTLTQRGSLYLYDLTEKKAYRTSAAALTECVSIKRLVGEIFYEYRLPADEGKITGFSFSENGALTVTAEFTFFSYTGEVTYVERDGFLTELRIPNEESSASPHDIYTFDFAPTDKTKNHPTGVKESDFEISDTYSVLFYLNLGEEPTRFSATTGETLSLPLGDVTGENYQIDGWYYDRDLTEPYEESVVPYCPVPLRLYAKTSLKSNLTVLTLIIGADAEPERFVFPAGDGTYLEDALRDAFPTPPKSPVDGLYSRFGSTCLGLFTDSAYTTPLETPLSAGEITAYAKTESYARLTLQFPSYLPDYRGDYVYYYPQNAVPSVSSKAFETVLYSGTGKCFTLWLDGAYTVPYAGELPNNGVIYLKHVPQENYVFVTYLHAETGALLNRMEAELNYPTYLLNPFDFDDATRVCTGVWFDAECTQSAVGELVTPEGELTLYCTFDARSPEENTNGQDAPR